MRFIQVQRESGSCRLLGYLVRTLYGHNERHQRSQKYNENKDIVFVYIANISSPKALGEEKIKIIGGEHYYLTQEECEYVMDNLGFDSIPTYLFYDTKGILKDKVTSYPGTE
ncbi:MAG: hypothetical protein VB024_07205 [Dysgonamonadaceae bacterium]|jgi:hypothetical protein|nr:hypothetical protein [Dysgonamonadaceae bacterium]